MRVFGYGWADEAIEDVINEPRGVSRIREYARRRRWGDCPVQLEDRSAAFQPFQQRPSGGALLATLKKGDALIAAELGDLFRSAVAGSTFLELAKARGVAVHCIDLGGDIMSGKAAEFLQAAVSMLAHFEPSLSRARARTRIQAARKSGRYTGGNAPFGYVVGADGKLKPDPNRRKVVRRILQLKATGLSLRQVAAKLTSDGLKISHNSVRKIITSARYQSAH